MTVEQLVLLIALVVVPLVQALARLLQNKRTARVEPGYQPEPVVSPPGWPEDPEPAVFVPPPAWPPAVPVEVRVPSRPRPVPPPAPPHPMLAEPPVRTVHRSRARLVPRDREGLRRATALVVILGPPKALEPKAPI